MTTDERLDRMEKQLSNMHALLHKLSGNLGQKDWVEYEEVRQHLDRSRTFYKEQRANGNLIEGKDYRRVGGKIEYNVKSVIALKEQIIKKSRYSQTKKQTTV